LSAIAGRGLVNLSWDAVPFPVTYNVKQSTNSAGDFVNVATGLPGTFHTVTGLSNGVTYYFVVTAANAFGNSTNSAPVGARPLSLAPATSGTRGRQTTLNLPGRHSTQVGDSKHRPARPETASTPMDQPWLARAQTTGWSCRSPKHTPVAFCIWLTRNSLLSATEVSTLGLERRIRS
jgi:hypothetical protein